MWKKVVSY